MEYVAWAFGAIAAIGITTSFVWQGISWYRSPERARERDLDKLPVTPIEKVVAGRVVKVRAFLEITAPLLQAPITGRKCAGWVLQVEKREGEDSTTVHSERAVGDFGLRSPTGALALVKARDLGCEISQPGGREHLVPEMVTPELAEYLERSGLPLDQRYEYFEYLLLGAQEITVVGVAEREPDPRAQAGYRMMAPTRVVFRRPPLRIIGPG